MIKMKEIYYIRDRETHKLLARLEKEGDTFTAYRIGDEYRPVAWFNLHGKRDVCSDAYIKMWLSNRTVPKRRENILEIMQHMNLPYWDPWLMCKAVSGRSTEDDYEMLDEDMNYTFSFIDEYNKDIVCSKYVKEGIRECNKYKRN